MDHGIPSAAWEGRAADCLFLNATAGKGGEKNRPLNWEGWEVGEGSGGGLAPALVTGGRCAGSIDKATLLGGNWWQLMQLAELAGCGHKSSPGISGHLHAARGTDLQCFHVGQRGRGFHARRGERARAIPRASLESMERRLTSAQPFLAKLQTITTAKSTDSSQTDASACGGGK